jgi:E3 ubiquitin-protein ligase SHPRH
LRVLLIPLSLGSNGLDIVEATHVFLVEPLINEAVESQAVARVARLGQTRSTFVHKYILNNTIEEKIHVAQSKALFTDSVNSKSSPCKSKSPQKSARNSESFVSSIDNIRILFE